MPRHLVRAGALLLAFALAGCGESPTADRGPATLRIVPVLAPMQGGLPILGVDELEVRAYDLSHATLVGTVTVPIAPNDVEVEVELRVTGAAVDAVVVEVELRSGARPVYFGGPVVAVASEGTIEVPVHYVGVAACDEWAGAVGVGTGGGAPVVVRGELEIGDCYRGEEVSFADRWRVDVAADAGLTFAVAPVGTQQSLYLRLTHLDGTALRAPAEGGLSVPLGAGSYLAEVTSAEPLARVVYDLSVVEYDRCDVAIGRLEEQAAHTRTLTSVDCPLADGGVAHLWTMDIARTGPYRIEVESRALDMEVVVTEAGATDPGQVEPVMADDNRGEGPFDALVAGVLEAGSYRVWSATSTPPGPAGDYQISMHRLIPGAPRAEVRRVEALGPGSGLCGNAHAFLFHFGFEDGDGDLVEGGGVTIRLTSEPSGIVEEKGVGWESFPDLNPYAGYATVTSCETFLPGDVAKRADFFLTDAEGRPSATTSQMLYPTPQGATGAPAAPAGGVVAQPQGACADGACGIR